MNSEQCARQTVQETLARLGAACDQEPRIQNQSRAPGHTPQLDWLFWGWLQCFIQYAFYQVISAAVIFIIGNILNGFMNQYGGQASGVFKRYSQAKLNMMRESVVGQFGFL